MLQPPPVTFVDFTFPWEPQKQILHGLSFTALPGQKVAFVGTTGCGKSTAIQLIQRFYAPNAGQVLLPLPTPSSARRHTHTHTIRIHPRHPSDPRPRTHPSHPCHAHTASQLPPPSSHRPLTAQVLLDGVPLEKYDVHNLRRQISVVAQVLLPPLPLPPSPSPHAPSHPLRASAAPM